MNYQRGTMKEIKDQLPPMRTGRRIPCLIHKKFVFEETQRLFLAKNQETEHLPENEDGEMIVEREPISNNVMYVTAL